MRLYIASAWQTPRFRGKGDSGKSAPVGADPIHVLWLHRRIQMGETDKEAMHCPLLRARWDLIAWAEQEGAIRILTAEDEKREGDLLQAARANAEWDIQMRKGGIHG